MILQALYKLYEELSNQNKVPKNGWYMAKISHRLVIDEGGNFISIENCRGTVTKGKKDYEVPIEKQCPYIGVRTSGVKPYFLCDTPKYLLGIDKNDDITRSLQCFEASKVLHIKLLSKCNSRVARAICLYYEKWESCKAKENPNVIEMMSDLWKGNNVIFSVRDAYGNSNDAIDDPEIQKIWDNEIASKVESKHVGPCLVTGESGQELAILHPNIKGIGQNNGPFVCYNLESFCSQGYSKDDQGLNATISEKAAMGYSAALNYLLSDISHKKRIAGTTVVYWSEHGISAYQDLLGKCNFGDLIKENDNIDNVMDQICRGEVVEVNGVVINPKEVFYILGLEMNTKRIIVRFFYRSNFGNIIKNIDKYQKNLRIIGAPENKPIAPWATIKTAFNAKTNDSDHASQLMSSLMYAIFNDTRYPEALFRNIMLRIFATQDNNKTGKEAIRKVTYLNASYIKAYLIQNHRDRWGKEGGIQMTVNENCNEKSYVLGRMFALLEEIQEDANPNINSNIKDRYFSGACTTPAKVFPVLLKLTNVHMQKLNKTRKGLAVTLQKKMGNLMAKINMPDSGVPFPSRLTLEEQGAFVVGYYQEYKDRFVSKNKVQEEENNE